MIKRLFAQAAADFGDSLAQELAKRYPVELDKSPGRISADRMSRILEGLYSRARQFHAENRLGLLGRTRLAHAFKWRLLELGYGKDFISLATEGLIVYFNKTPGAQDELLQAQQKRLRKQERNRNQVETPAATVDSPDGSKLTK
jgi:hypothetical protein